MKQRVIKIAQLANSKAPFIEWMNSLDKAIKSRVQSRLTRLLENNFGDHKKIDSEISELRLSFGSGYRIYYVEIDSVIVLLINGGDKSTQTKDIEKAKIYFKNGENCNERTKTRNRFRKLHS
jgi:putative addiction module killer protein